MFDLGDTVTLTWTTAEGAPASGTVTLTVTLPDGTSATPTVSGPTSGAYSADFLTTQPGRHGVRWTSDTTAYTDTFDVDEQAPTGIVSLADVKAHLNITSTTNDEELRRYIDAATDFIEGKVGPVVRRTITKTVWPLEGELSVQPPLVSLTSVTSAYGYAGTYDIANMFFDPDTGVIQYGAYGATFAYPVTVTYVAGRVVVPALIRQAALDYIKWMWETQRGAAPLPTPGGEYDVVTPATVPYRITQALEPYMSASSGVA